MVDITHPDKVLFPKSGFTKADLVHYYERAAEPMAPHIVGRPLTLHRFPNGIGQKGFLQKNAPDYFPPEIRRVEIPKQDGTGLTTYPVLTDPGWIPYLANLGTITFHVWTSAVPHLEQPDRLIFDLDPPESEVDLAVPAAGEVRALLHALGLVSAVMTTGSKGYHIVVPVQPELDFEAVSRFAQTVSALLAASHPDLLTDEFRIANRRGRVFVDWLRNRWGQTGVAAWSIRAKEGQPVATPIGWDEIETTPPDAYSAETVIQRFDIDPIAELTRTPQRLGEAVAEVARLAGEAGIEPARFDRFRA